MFATIVAVSAFGGTWGLASGTLDLGHTVNQRLPFHSPVFGGIALAVVVGGPAVIVAVLALRRDPRIEVACTGAGFLLLGWIAVEVAFIRELSFLQVVYAAAGVAYVVLGRHRSRAWR